MENSPSDHVIAAELAENYSSGWAKLTREERVAIKAFHIAKFRANSLNSGREVLRMIRAILEFVCVPRFVPANYLGVAYALDIPQLHNEMNMEEMAKKTGYTRAAISNAARKFCAIVGIEPSRWMRSDETAEENKQARIEHCTIDPQ